jgi:hypothetical protein
MFIHLLQKRKEKILKELEKKLELEQKKAARNMENLKQKEEELKDTKKVKAKTQECLIKKNLCLVKAVLRDVATKVKFAQDLVGVNKATCYNETCNSLFRSLPYFVAKFIGHEFINIELCTSEHCAW